MSDFDAMANLFRIQNMSGGGGGGGGDATDMSMLVQGGLNQTIDNLLTRIIGFPVNPSLENKGWLNQVDIQNFGQKQFSLQSAPVTPDLQGGILAKILQYFTRELPAGLDGPISLDGGGEMAMAANVGGGGGDFDSGGSTGGGGGGGGGDGGGESYASDTQAFAGGGAEIVAQQYGDKMVYTQVSDSELGNLSPPTAGDGGGRSEGFEVG